MNKVVKWISIVVAILVLFFILAFICLITFVSPNHFKSVIAQKINDATGRQLIIEGDLSWTLFPRLGVKTDHMTLSNPTGFKQPVFAEVEEATVGVKLIPLFRKKIESSGIRLVGMKLHLIKNTEGVENWNFNIPSSKQVSQTAEEMTSHTSSSSAFAVAGTNITIINSEVTWENEKTKQTASIDNFNLQAKGISMLYPVPFTTDFDFTSSDLAAKGHVSLESKTAIDLYGQVFSFREISLKVNAEKGDKKIQLTLNGDAVADLKAQRLQVTHVEVNMGDLKLTGQIHVTDLKTTPNAKGHFQVAPFDMRKWLDDMGQDVSNIQTMKMVTGELDFTPGKSMYAEGKLNIDTLQLHNVTVTNVKVPIKYQNGVLDLKSISGGFYQGTLQADSSVDLNKNTPQVSLQTKISNFNAGALMNDVGSSSKLKFTGDGNIDLNVTTSGAGLRNLNGNGRFNISSGALQGIDIAYLVNSAAAFIKKQSVSGSNAGQTPFSDFRGSFTIRNGVFSNNDLSVNSSGLITQGQGSVDLVSETINYHLQTLVGKSFVGNLINLTGVTIPIIISGSLRSPNIGLDVGGLAKGIAAQQLKNITNVGSDVGQSVTNPVIIPKKAGKFIQNLLGH